MHMSVTMWRRYKDSIWLYSSRDSQDSTERYRIDYEELIKCEAWGIWCLGGIRKSVTVMELTWNRLDER